MEPINISFCEEAVKQAIAEGLETFYQKLITKIEEINIRDVIKSKNPYLYRAKSMQTSAEIIDSILQAFVSSSEETIFGNCFFEPIAIAASGGTKSNAEGIDIELLKPAINTKYAIAVKSGTAAFNGDSKNKQADNFAKAQRALRTSGGRIQFKPIIGYGYGTKEESERGRAKIYEEVAGEEFWTMISGDENLYTKIIAYMDTLPEQYIDEFKDSYARASNRLVRDFTREFCEEDGSINWVKLVDFNSGSPARKRKEALLLWAKAVYGCIKDNQSISQNAMKETLCLGDGAVRKAISFLLENNYITRGHDGKKKGWTIQKELDL